MPAVASRFEPVVATLQVRRLGCRPYDEVLALQETLLATVAEGGPETLLLLEHPPVYTLGRGADAADLRGAPERLGVPCFRVGRGGGATFHGPGQLVAYPIVRLADRDLLLRPFVRALEAALVETCAALGVEAGRRDGHPGCWVDSEAEGPRKIGALGVRIERGTSYHGVALNVDPDIAGFDLIDPCGMPGLVSTSIATELGRHDEQPSTARVAAAAAAFAPAFARGLKAELRGTPATDADPDAERRVLEALAAPVAA